MTNETHVAGATTQPSDPAHLRLLSDVLTSLAKDFDVLPPDVDADEVRRFLLQRRDEARAQAQDLLPRTRRPVVLDPEARPAVQSRQGQPLVELITARTATTVDLSSAEVRMQARHVARAHVHHHTGLLLVVLRGRAITLWWDEDGAMHELPQRPRQHLYMPPGVPHAAVNPYRVPVVAAEVRASPIFGEDNDLLPDLDAAVSIRMASLLPA
jgi:uncharacterized RmlC-like cupin family protein